MDEDNNRNERRIVVSRAVIPHLRQYQKDRGFDNLSAAANDVLRNAFFPQYHPGATTPAESSGATAPSNTLSDFSF